MTGSARLDSLRADGELLSRLTADDPAAPVLTCPGWTTADVLGHTGGGFLWAITVVTDRAAAYERDLPDPPAGLDDLFAWYDDALGRLAELFAKTDGDLPCWVPVGSWATVGWWQRKMAVEAALHRYDVDAATCGRPHRKVTPLHPEVAGDGIEEFVSDFLPGLLVLAEDDRFTGTVRLAPVDDPRSWRLDLDAPTRAVVDRSPGAAADTILSATASDLLLWMWNRLPDAGRIEVAGEAGIVTDWSRLTI